MAVCEDKEQDPRIRRIASSIRVVPDFPKKGIMFQDITTLLLDPKAFKDTADLFVERYTGKGISVVAGEFLDHLVFGVEARGFIFGPPIALAIGAKFIPLRKPRKLPGEVISENYVLEYGTDCLQMHVGAVQPGERALVVDDLIATGGTLCAAISLLGEVISENYVLEYGTDCLQMHVGAVQPGERALVVDDLIATGGTLCAAISLLERAGAEVVECACVIELPELKGAEKLNGKPLYILMESH